MAFLPHSSQRLYGFQSPREDGPNCHTSHGFADWDVATAGEKGAASHLQRRDMKGEGEERDQNKRGSSRRQEKKGGRRTRPVPKYPSCFLRRRPKLTLGKAFCEGKRL